MVARLDHAGDGERVAYYRAVGAVPRTRHTAFRDDAGNLRYEELMGEEGFSSDSSLLYHAGVPSAIVDSQPWELPDLGTIANHPLKPRHLRLHEVPAAGDPSPAVAWCWATATSGSATSSPTRLRRTTATPSATSACTSSRAAARSRRPSACSTYRTGDYVVDPARHHAPVGAERRRRRGVPALRDRGEQPHRSAEALPLPLRPAPRARAVLRARPARSGRAARARRAPTSRCWSSTGATARPGWSARG